MMTRTMLAGVAMMSLAACGESGGGDDYESFMAKCRPVAQMMEQQGGASSNLMSASNTEAACDCAWDKYRHEGGSASSGAIRAMVRGCLAEIEMEPE
ncbi:hypothetical protein [Henriciella aquimarina]|uniref:hypothetical protein n=1 Tax=Henriciella aquimarina TaxID=545261 RepID=UPI000A00F53C|nr:hypothetical protein [Henriciella aquimarina]